MESPQTARLQGQAQSRTPVGGRVGQDELIDKQPGLEVSQAPWAAGEKQERQKPDKSGAQRQR